ncbi:MAG: RAMP superfamily CRISPR-associated protein, partial [Longicatena sp.]
RSGVREYKEAGLLKKENGKWNLYEANSYPLYDVKRDGKNKYRFSKGPIELRTGKFIEEDFDSRNLNGQRKRLHLKGYVLLGEYFNDARNDHLFEFNDESHSIKEDCKIEVENLEEILKRYRNPKINKQLENTGKRKHYGYPDYNLEEHNVMPVWYKKGEQGKFYLSPAAIGKNVYYKTLYDFLKRDGESKGYQPCSDREALCPACNLFGMISNSGSVNSRVRFSDAIYKDVDFPYAKEAKLKELATPQIGNTEFYTNSINKNATKWNFDTTGVDIKGRKFYWHNPNPTYTNEILFNERCKLVKPLKEHLHFTFKIFFDHVNEKELNLLAYALDFGSSGKDQCHKIGMGKPLGIGSVKIKVKAIKQRKVSVQDNNIKYELLDFNRNLKCVDTSTLIMQNLLKITNFNAFTELKKSFAQKNEELIYDYPRLGEQKDARDTKHGSLKWFVENANGKNAKNPIKLETIDIPTVPENSNKPNKNNNHNHRR